MFCPFCRSELYRRDIETWGSFACPKCHKLVRVRRNYAVRILRLGLITPVLLYLLVQISGWFQLHLRFTVFISAGSVGAIDEYVMRFLPAHIEPASPGSLI
jgi:hypothetical protein